MAVRGQRPSVAAVGRSARLSDNVAADADLPPDQSLLTLLFGISKDRDGQHVQPRAKSWLSSELSLLRLRAAADRLLAPSRLREQYIYEPATNGKVVIHTTMGDIEVRLT